MSDFGRRSELLAILEMRCKMLGRLPGANTPPLLKDAQILYVTTDFEGNAPAPVAQERVCVFTVAVHCEPILAPVFPDHVGLFGADARRVRSVLFRFRLCLFCQRSGRCGKGPRPSAQKDTPDCFGGIA